MNRKDMKALANEFERLRAAYKAAFLVKDTTAFHDFCFKNSDQLSAALRASAAPSLFPDFESAALALGFQKVGDRWIHPNDDPLFPRRYRSAEAIFNGLFTYAAPETGRIPAAKQSEAEIGWRIDVDWLTKMQSEVEKATGYHVTLECVEETVLRTAATLSPDSRKAPVAFVPIHPRQGPLWSDTFPANSEVERSQNYKRMPLYAALAPATEDGGREKEALRNNLREAWAALAMIRETIETLGSVGSVKASEHLDGPTFMHEAEALVAGIVATLSPSPSVGTGAAE